MIHGVRLFAAIGLLLLTSISLIAQNSEPVIPDLTGLNVSQAAAALNRAGFALGEELAAQWTPEAGVSENTVSLQSVAAGTSAPVGTKVDVTILRTPNVTLIYDDNDLTVLNLGTQRINLEDVVFNSVEGTGSASFNANRWAGRIRPGYCTQIWSVGRNAAKEVEGCTAFEQWITTNQSNEHFWTAVNGIVRFNVTQGGVERGICDAAPSSSQDRPLTCTLYLASAGQSDNAAFIYFAYTNDRFIIRNNTPDVWMRLNRFVIFNANPNNAPFGASFEPGNPNLFGNPETVARIQRLAPNQCLLFIANDAADSTPPESCDVIATLKVAPDQLFWTFDFNLQSVSDSKQRLCRAATPGKLTLCIMPR